MQGPSQKKNSFRRLDVGCGDTPTGDVNVDFHPFVQTWMAAGKRTKADIIADAQHLPFKDKSFEEVYSSHLIEHLYWPASFVKEAERVATDRIKIICPSRWMKDQGRNPFHKWSMTRKWFAEQGYQTEVNLDNLFHGRFLSMLKIPFLPVRLARVNEIIARKELTRPA